MIGPAEQRWTQSEEFVDFSVCSGFFARCFQSLADETLRHQPVNTRWSENHFSTNTKVVIKQVHNLL